MRKGKRGALAAGLQKNDHLEKVREWRAKYYHKPQDGINGIFDFEAGKKYVQLTILISYLVAQEPGRPKWNPGDFFESFGNFEQAK